jgi:hypothetical protein
VEEVIYFQFSFNNLIISRKRDKKMLTVVIHITNFGESPELAVKSVIANKGLFNQLHFIYPAFQTEEESMYSNWLLIDKPNLNGVDVFFHVLEHAKNYSPESIIVRIPPNCEVKSGGFSSIKNAMKHANEKQSQFALSPVTVFNRFSIWTGFFIVLMLIETFWNRIFERGKLIEYTDVKAYFVMKKGKTQFFPDERGGGWIFNPTVIPKSYAGGTCVLRPFDDGYLMWKLHTHTNLKLMGYWILFYIPIYFMLAISWPSVLWGAISFSNIYFASYVISVWIFEVIVSYWVGSYYISCPKRIVYSLLFPVYWFFFPYVLIYARLTVPQKSWQ